jgi:hypothetical protein
MAATIAQAAPIRPSLARLCATRSSPLAFLKKLARKRFLFEWVPLDLGYHLRGFLGRKRLQGTEKSDSHLAPMRARHALPLLALLSACSSQKDKQLEAVESARSVVSEWALVEEQAAQGRAQATYVGQMREMARDELKTAEAALSEQPGATRLLEGLRAGSPNAATLKQANETLKPLEDRLEVS